MKNLLYYSVAVCIATSSLFYSCKPDDGGSNSGGDPTFGTFTDSRDNKTYGTVKIGTQTWMTENLNFRNVPAGVVTCYDNVETNCDTLGALYDFEAAQVACPPGSQLPSDEEWKTLEAALGMDSQELDLTSWRGDGVGTIMKEGDLNLILAGSYIEPNCNCYLQINSTGRYWTSTNVPNTDSVYFRQVTNSPSSPVSKVGRVPSAKSNRLSIRCIIKN